MPDDFSNADDFGIEPEKHCSFGFNSNLAGRKVSEFGPDVVVVFEGKVGQDGEPVLTVENHEYVGKGCNVLFNDGCVVGVKAEDVGKLNWGEERKE